MKNIPSIRIALTMTLLVFAAMTASGESKPPPKRIFVANVEMPKKPDIVGKGGIAAALLGGPLAAFAADGANNDIEAAYALLLAKNGIDVGTDVAFEAMKQLAAKRIDVPGTADQSDATLKIVVQNYGLSVFKGSECSRPIMTAIFILTGSDGKKLWTKQVIWSLVKEFPTAVQPHPIPDYFNDPKILVREMGKLNSLIVSAGLSKL